MQQVLDRVFRLSAGIRYVALYYKGRLTSAVRPLPAAESDTYEELLVNPALLTLARQRGDIDCGGLDFLVIRYGSFYQLVWPLSAGHLSVGIEPGQDPLPIVPGVRAVAAELDRRAAWSERSRAKGTATGRLSSTPVAGAASVARVS
jgi:hypothetical protein